MLVPYWELLHEEFFRDEADFREVWVSAEQQLRDFWHNQHVILKRQARGVPTVPGSPK